MKFPLKPFAVALVCVGCFISNVSFAQTASKNAQTKNKASLENDVANLRKEVRELKSQLANGHTGVGQAPVNANTSHHSTRGARSSETRNPSARLSPLHYPSDKTANYEPHPETTDHGGPLTGAELVRMMAEQKNYLPFDLDVPGQSFVSTGPYVGVPIQFSGSNLLINSPSVNTDLTLLQIRRTIHKQLMAMGGLLDGESYHSHLLMSGLVEGQANYTNIGGSPSTSTIDVTNMSVDLFFLGPSNWLLGFVELTYNNGNPRSDVWESNNSFTVANSRVFVNKAFVTIGDLEKSRIYGTFGQFYVPFGTYSSVMVSDTLPKLLARTKARAIELAFAPAKSNSFFGSAYIFRGDSHAASVSKINNGGLNLGYVFESKHFNGRVGAGVIGNIADSGGMQQAGGFAYNEQIVHRVPAYNLRAVLDIGDHFDFIAEWVGTSTRFNPNDLSYNGRGAKPSAIDLEASYSFNILCDRPSSLGIGYAKSNQALGLGIPLTRTSMVFNTSLWRNTLQSLEFRHDRNYAASDTANGPITGLNPVPACTEGTTCSATGKSDNAITAQFDYYF